MNQENSLPADLAGALLVGRVWRPAPIDGPSVVVVRNGEVIDITAVAPTVSDLLDRPDRVALAKSAKGESLGDVRALMDATLQNQGGVRLLAPCDLQPIKAAGVTFAISLLERMIEEEAGGDASRADEIRVRMQALIGSDLSRLRPGSDQAAKLKAELVERGQWSQYLEVGIGPDAEIFSKAQPMSAVGHLAEIGIHPISTWNNPEPEVVLVVSSNGKVVGATLGNDVNLRDVEGRSALLLSKAKDNNASASVGPMIRLFDGGFSLDDVRQTEVRLTVDGEDDGFRMDGSSAMSKISRDPEDLVKQTVGKNHQYPDGFVLYLGTMFAPVQDRDGPGQGFTHKVGDIVTISAPKLGSLSNRVVLCPDAEPWTFGTAALMRNLAGRGLL